MPNPNSTATRTSDISDHLQRQGQWRLPRLNHLLDLEVDEHVKAVFNHKAPPLTTSP